MNKSSILALSALTILISGAANGANSSTSKFDQAVAVYLTNDYAKALPLFQALEKTEAKNANVHYYIALCGQQLDNDKLAAEEYKSALAKSKDPAFKEIIQERLARTERRLGKLKAQAEASPPPLQKHDAVKKIIWFSTNWCSTCKRFEPAWEMGKTKFAGKLNFVHLNAEDPANWKIVEKYRPKAYPTLVFLDGKDNVIRNYADAPEGKVFVAQLEEMGASDSAHKTH